MTQLWAARSSLLRQSDFRWFFSGQIISLFGTTMAPVALAFGVLDASGGVSALGIILAAHMVPMLAFLLVGGAIADTFPRRTILVCANLSCALTQGCVAILFLTDQFSLPVVALLEFLNGIFSAFTRPALRGIVPQLVEKKHLQQANALLGSARSSAKILGPSISGVIVVVVGSGPAIAIDAVTYLLGAGCLARLSVNTGAGTQGSTGLLVDIRHGWAEFRGIPWVWRVTVSFCVINLVQTGTWQILGPSLTDELSGRETWGFALSAQGLGVLSISVLMYRLTARHLLRSGQLMTVLGALPLLLLGAHAQAHWLIIGAFIAGLGSGAGGISWDTSLQEHIPAHVLSRVTSYDDLLSYAAIPVGQLCVGPLAERFGGYTVTTAAGLVYLVAAVAPLVSGTVRRLPHHRLGSSGRSEIANSLPDEDGIVRKDVLSMSGDEQDYSRSPEETVADALRGYMITQVISTAARLGLVDELGDATLSLAEISSACEVDESVLPPFLAVLERIEVVHQPAPGRFRAGPMAKELHGGQGSLHGLAMLTGAFYYEAWGGLEYSMRTGDTAFDHVHGRGMWDALAEQPDAAAWFAHIMRSNTQKVVDDVLASYDFSAARVICDLGAGDGALAAGILRAHPAMRALVVEQSFAVEHSRTSPRLMGVTDRCEFLEADLLVEVPAGADVYLLKSVIHNWRDQEAIRILENCRKSMGVGARLLVIEKVRHTDSLVSALRDLNMMVLFGSRDRSAEEYEALLRQAGFSVEATVDHASGLCVLEAVPVASDRNHNFSLRTRLASSFGDQAKAYAEHRPDYPTAAVRWALELVPSSSHLKILDLGAGTGALTGVLAREGLNVTAVEPDPGMLAELRRRLPFIRAKQGAAESIPLPDASVDAVFIGQALHWFDLERAVPELARVLRPGGVVAGLWNSADHSVDWVRRVKELARNPCAHTETDWEPANWQDECIPPCFPGFSTWENSEFPHYQSRSAESLTATLGTHSHMLVLEGEARTAALSRVHAYLLSRNETASGEFKFPLVTAVARCVRTKQV
ncbi:MFS transporter [Streptomyces sp. NPDC005706]|uniref:MFS transporter n=1 Tax=Streptomyces sp. NPDC005706 TaxID=3157169 RepID=UPI0033D29C71